jgi:hypothetical protein
MAPTIRIDEEVYAWLQTRARPFEDSPNTVLRRLAELDTVNNSRPEVNRVTMHDRTGKLQQGGPGPLHLKGGRGRTGLTGQQLNDEWSVGARHALYHADGHWYENLERFPAALFDPHGYVVFKTAEEFNKSPYLKIGKKTNVPGGISRLPGYVRKR